MNVIYMDLPRKIKEALKTKTVRVTKISNKQLTELNKAGFKVVIV